jgi:hypothetical protein
VRELTNVSVSGNEDEVSKRVGWAVAITDKRRTVVWSCGALCWVEVCFCRKVGRNLYAVGLRVVSEEALKDCL